MVVGDFVEDVDVLVIGSGPGGYVAAIRAAQLGKSVVIVDRGAVGGVCLNVGCIPSKALISAAKQYEDMSQASEIGIEVEGVKVNFEKIQQWKDSVVNKLTGGVSYLLKGNKIKMLSGEAFFTGPDTVSVSNEEEGNRYKFKHCIIATGSRPIELPSMPFGGRVISSTEALALQEIPKSMVVIGGGYIGIELGQVYAKFGTKVTVLEGTDAILPGFEKEMSRAVHRSLEKLDANIVTNALASGVEQTDTDATVTYTVDGKEEKVTADYVLVTVGRRPNTDELGLDNIGMNMTERGLIEVNEQGLTNIPNVYAIGDIVPGFALAHKASYEGKVAAEAIAGQASIVDYNIIPEVVFSDPEVASVGLNETKAKEQGIEVKVGKFNFAANGRALTMNAAEGFVKIIADAKDNIVIGAQIVGPEASNLISEMGTAIEMRTTLEDIALTIHAHPTLGEIVMEAAEDALGRAIHQL